MTGAERIVAVCDKMKEMLLRKNAAYGDSVFNPVRILSSSSPEEQVRVRLDDKLSRLVRGRDDGENTLADLTGYFLILLSMNDDWVKAETVDALPAVGQGPVHDQGGS